MDSQPVVVVGLMGAGKTTVAQRVAQVLGRPFRDNDADLSAEFDSSAAEQFADLGSSALHRREAQMLQAALRERPAAVIAAAASVVDDPVCQAALAPAFVVWLTAPPHVLAGRIGAHDHRPRFDRDPVAMLARQAERRSARFEAVADLVVDVEAHDSKQTIATVLAALAARRSPAIGT